MIRLAITVVPHGVEQHAHLVGEVTIANEGPTSNVEARDPQGERHYRWESPQSGGTAAGNVKHRRSDGIARLCALVLADLDRWVRAVSKGGDN